MSAFSPVGEKEMKLATITMLAAFRRLLSRADEQPKPDQDDDYYDDQCAGR